MRRSNIYNNANIEINFVIIDLCETFVCLRCMSSCLHMPDKH